MGVLRCQMFCSSNTVNSHFCSFPDSDFDVSCFEIQFRDRKNHVTDAHLKVPREVA